jgi:fumarate reductase subunit D
MSTSKELNSGKTKTIMIVKIIQILFGLLLVAGLLNGQALGGTEMPESPDGPFTVEMSVFLVDVDDIDAAEQNFTANVMYTASWYDPNIAERFDEKDILPVTELWTPNLQVVNQQKIWPTLPEVVQVNPDGKVFYQQRVWGQFSMPFNLRNFPFDTQDFSIQFMSVASRGEKIKFIQSKEISSGLAEKFSQADWKILKWEANEKKFTPRETIDRDGFIMTFWAERKTGYYIIKMIIPLILIVMMSWTVFWVDPKDAGTQVGVAVTSMLTLIAYRFATDALLPKVSYLTRLDYFILGSTILIFSGLIEVLVTSSLAKKDKLDLARLVDKFARVLMPLFFLGIILKAFVF